VTAQVSVWNETGFIAHLPRFTGLAWEHEFNQAGTFRLSLHLDDSVLAAHADLLDPGNVVVISTGGVKRRGFLIESVEESPIADGDERTVTISGRGVLAMLSWALVYAEVAGISGSFRYDQSDDRDFDFGSLDGSWRITSEWVTPLGIRQDSGSSIRKGYPVNWPIGQAEWLWITNPNAATAPQRNYFRSSFLTTATSTRITVFAAGDDRMRLKLDGEEIAFVTGGWKNITSYTTDVAAGTHLIAAEVDAIQFEGANSPAGFLFAVARVDRNGKVLSWLRTSAPGNTKVRQLLPGGDAPGWFSANILRLLVLEGVERNVHRFDEISMPFTDFVDSDSVAWTGRHDRNFRIGTDYLDVLAQLTEHDIDVDMTWDLVLNAWKNRGDDLSADVQLVSGGPKTGGTQTVSNALRTYILARGRSGWLTTSNGAAVTAHGRREGLLTVGSALSDSQTRRASNANLGELKDPMVTTTVEVSSAKGPQPYEDFDMGDTVTSIGYRQEITPCRFMGLAARVDDHNSEITYLLKMYPVTT
jgi:hypothetical protein